jgi:hypothetical protein
LITILRGLTISTDDGELPSRLFTIGAAATKALVVNCTKLSTFLVQVEYMLAEVEYIADRR